MNDKKLTKCFILRIYYDVDKSEKKCLWEPNIILLLKF